MNTLQQKQLAFLEDTVNFYNSENRVLAHNGACIYSSTVKSPGCAIGRHLSKDLARDFDVQKIMFNDRTDDLFVEYFEKLPTEIKELGDVFLGEIQALHDGGFNWNKDGISETGKIEIERIKKSFNL